MGHTLVRSDRADIGMKRRRKSHKGDGAVAELAPRRTIFARLWDFCCGIEFATPAEIAQRETYLDDTRADAARWRARAEALEAQVDDLEDRLAASDTVTMDLRARLICLHGKLATTAATARYQSFSTALEALAGAPADRRRR